MLDPLCEVRGAARVFRLSYNPFSDIDMKEGGGVRQIHAYADAIIHPEKGNGAHFGERRDDCGRPDRSDQNQIIRRAPNTADVPRGSSPALR